MNLLSTERLMEVIEHYVNDHDCNHTNFDPESCSTCLAKLQLALYEMGYGPEDDIIQRERDRVFKEMQGEPDKKNDLSKSPEDNRIDWQNFWDQIDARFSGKELRKARRFDHETVKLCYEDGSYIEISVDDPAKKYPTINKLDFKDYEKGK